MNRRLINLLLILVLVAVVVYIDLPSTESFLGRSTKTVLGLDLRGGVQVLLEPPADFSFTPENLEDAKAVLENRSNGLGVSEVVFQVAGDRYILGEFPGVTDTDQVISIIQQTGMLEFIDAGATYLEVGTPVETDYTGATTDAASATPEVTATPDAAATPEATPAATDTAAATPVYHTLMTGSDLESVSVTFNSTSNEYEVAFKLSDSGAAIFSQFTSNNVGKYVAIVLDKAVISCPVIKVAITDGQGVIQGNFTQDSANNLAITLRYGSLPIPLQVAQSRSIEPTLGQDSLNKSLLAGIIGFAIVALFMIIYYRLPGVVAVLAILIYAAITFAIYKLLPVTLSLPGIAGFLLSTGSALDANILTFERLKEELRAGRPLDLAIDLAWKRAWSSIRDSNLATIITSLILFWFGSTFGASIVKGFALTLVLGVVVSLFTAIVVTRTFLGLTTNLINPANHQKWFGA